MEFSVRTPRNRVDTVEVRYDCACGCKPRARYERGTDDAGYEHCCCGQIHFVGASAEERLKLYLDERSKSGLDEDIGGYTFYSQQISAPWGDLVPVAYAVPTNPRDH